MIDFVIRQRKDLCSTVDSVKLYKISSKFLLGHGGLPFSTEQTLQLFGGNVPLSSFLFPMEQVRAPLSFLTLHPYQELPRHLIFLKETGI